MLTIEQSAIAAHAEAYFDEGHLLRELAERIAYATESAQPEAEPILTGYLENNIVPALARMGFNSNILREPDLSPLPVLVARRFEAADLPTVLIYGHGDVVRGVEAEWSPGLDPWRMERRGDRVFGRGTADNKGQHTVNLAALSLVLAARGHLGFNTIVLMEMGEEIGSPGLQAFCERHHDLLAADMLIASDGPRWSAQRPTVFLGARGAIDLEISVRLRDRSFHCGNWGGWLANPGLVLARALTAITDMHGRPRIPALATPAEADALAPYFDRLAMPDDLGGQTPDADWGDSSVAPPARLLNRNNLEVLAFDLGDVDKPIYSIAPSARALCHVSFLPESKPESFAPAIEAELEKLGFEHIEVKHAGLLMPASRTPPDHPLVGWVVETIRRWSGKPVDLLPNFGGALPNWIFRDVLKMPTIWIPHSYGGSGQHGPDEHALASVLKEGLVAMTGLFWDLGEIARTPHLKSLIQP